jgi:hypothetical protein
MITDQVVVEISFNGADFSERDIAEHRRAFDDFCVTRTTTFSMPAAGSGFEIAVVIRFLFEAVVGGIAYDLIKEAGIRVLKMLDSEPTPQLSNLHLVFQNRDIVLGYDTRGHNDGPSPDEFFISADVLNALDQVLQQVFKHVAEIPLSAETFQWLWVPVRAARERKADVPLIRRYWQISRDREPAYGLGRYYDSHDRLLFNITTR